MILTYVSSDRQLADPLTKPTSALINSTIFPQWGLVVGRLYLNPPTVLPLRGKYFTALAHSLWLCGPGGWILSGRLDLHGCT